MKLKQLFESSWGRTKIPPELQALIPKFLSAAQNVYDEWDEELTDVYANGGICHIIADAIVSVLYDAGFEEVTTVNSQVGENHVWAVVAIRKAEDDEEYITVYEVDIPPHIYETGGGYSWQKIPDVTFTPNDLIIGAVCHGHDCIENYFGDY